MTEELEQQQKDHEEMSRYRFFDDYQDFTDSTAIYPWESALEYCALGLTSEAGEVAGKIKKMIRGEQVDIDSIIAELGDVLWYTARLAAELDVFLSDVAQVNVEKLTSRKNRGVLKGDGDER